MQRQNLAVIASAGQFLGTSDGFLSFDGELVEAHRFSGSIELLQSADQTHDVINSDMTAIYASPCGVISAIRCRKGMRLQDWQSAGLPELLGQPEEIHGIAMQQLSFDFPRRR